MIKLNKKAKDDEKKPLTAIKRSPPIEPKNKDIFEIKISPPIEPNINLIEPNKNVRKRKQPPPTEPNNTDN